MTMMAGILQRDFEEPCGVTSENQLDVVLTIIQFPDIADLGLQIGLGESAREVTGIAAEDDSLWTDRFHILAKERLGRPISIDPFYPLV